jgi:ferredoxin
MRITRRVFQAGFLALVLWGVFVLYGHCEKWCPFGGVESIYTYLTEGNMTCSLGVSNFFTLAALLVSVILLRRAFCGYVCPVGTLSDWTRSAAGRAGLKEMRIPSGLDRALSLLKYVVLAVILYFTWQAGELLFRGYCPAYALLSRHGEDITRWAYIVAGAILVVSLVVAMPFCRWFCPLAAVMNPLSRFGLTRIRRETEACTDCGLCTRACPMAIPVESMPQVTSARCISCFSCTDACPRGDEKALAWGPPRWLGGRWPKFLLPAMLLVLIGASIGLDYAAPLPSFVKTRPDREAAETAAVTLDVDGVRCRGRANLLYYFLDRDDLYELPGYLKLEAWPSPGSVKIRVTYDPTQTDEQTIKQAITEPYYELDADAWRDSPFTIPGHDPLAL